MAEAGEPETGKAIEVAKGKGWGAGGSAWQAMTVPFLNKQHPNLIKPSLGEQKEKAKVPQKPGLAMVEKGRNPCPALFVLQGEFTMLMLGSNSQRPWILALEKLQFFSAMKAQRCAKKTRNKEQPNGNFRRSEQACFHFQMCKAQQWQCPGG